MSTRTEEQDMSTEPTVTDEQLAASPQAFDAKLADAYEAWQKATDARERVRDAIYRAAGYKKTWQGRQQVWLRPFSEALQDLRAIAYPVDPAGYPSACSAASIKGRELLDQYGANEVRLAEAALVVQQMEEIYRRPENRWQRFFPCTNRDGHIHDSYRGCPTVRFDTPMAWRPDLSGTTVEQAVQMPPKGLGPALCSICFPLAPVEQRSMTTGQVADELTRDEREAAKAARELAKAAKTLTEDEQFRTKGQFSDLVTTVARCKELIRKAVEEHIEALWYARPEAASQWQGDVDQLARVRANIVARSLELDADAEQAARVLMARERKHAGWGADAAAIAKIRASKDKSARREWGLA